MNNDDYLRIELCRRVDRFFSDLKLSKKANKAMVAKCIFLILGLLGLYTTILMASYSILVSYLLWAGFGLFCGLCGVNIAHDALHGGLSYNFQINKYFGYIFNLLGISPYLWNIQHNIVHHNYTNVHTYDRDLTPAGTVLRLSPHQELHFYHKFQAIYALPLYSLAIVNWIFIKDFVLFFGERIGYYIWKKRPFVEFLKVMSCKILHLFLFLIVPILLIDLPIEHIIGGWFVGTLVEGLFVAILFMVAHVVEGVSFFQPEDNVSSFMRQILASSSFSTQSKFWNFICGGLNFQIEHHLFPGICHVHYPQISLIVKQVAAEYGVQYNLKESFFEAIQSHFKMLHDLGRSEHLEEIKVFGEV